MPVLHQGPAYFISVESKPTWIWLRATPCAFLRAPAQIPCPLSCAVLILSIGVHVLGEDCDVSYYIGKRLKLSYIIAIISSLLFCCFASWPFLDLVSPESTSAEKMGVSEDRDITLENVALSKLGPGSFGALRPYSLTLNDDDDVYYYVGERLKLEGETDDSGV